MFFLQCGFAPGFQISFDNRKLWTQSKSKSTSAPKLPTSGMKSGSGFIAIEAALLFATFLRLFNCDFKEVFCFCRNSHFFLYSSNSCTANSTRFSRVSTNSFFLRRLSCADIWNNSIYDEFGNNSIRIGNVSFTLFLIFLLIFFSDFSSAFVRGNFAGIGYPSDMRVFFSSSVRIKTPHPSVCKRRRNRFFIKERIRQQMAFLLHPKVQHNSKATGISANLLLP